jgi:hypothetical protein
MSKRVGFTGTSRGMTEAQRGAAAALRELGDVAEAHHGDCVGADAEFHALCQNLGIPVVIHPPSDPKKRAHCQGGQVLPERPYLDRNRAIVDAGDVLLAAPAEQEGERLLLHLGHGALRAQARPPGGHRPAGRHAAARAAGGLSVGRRAPACPLPQKRSDPGGRPRGRRRQAAGPRWGTTERGC